MLLRDAEVSRKKELADLLYSLPIEKLSAEVHINELFDIYVNSNLWKLSNRITNIFNENQNCIDNKLSSLSLQMDQMNRLFS